MSEKLIIEVNLTRGNTSSAFKEIERKGKGAGKNIGDSFSKNIGGALKKALAGFAGLALVTKGVREFNEQVAQSIETLRAFTRSVANVNSILPENDKLTKQSTDTFRNFASSFSTTSARQADAFYSIVSAGVKTTATQLETLEVANEAAIAGLVDINDATQLLVSSVNAYATSGLTAGSASDTLFAAVREGQTTFRELAGFLGNTTSIASSAGASFKDLAGTLAFVTKAGIKTDRAVIGLRQLFSTLIKVTPQAAKAAKSVGLEFSTTALRAKGLAGFLKDVAVRTKGNNEVLGKLFGNVRALNPVLAVVNGNFDDYQRILRETNSAQGDTARAADEIRKSLDFKLEKLNASFRILTEEIAVKLAPSLIFLADKFTKIIRLFTDSTPEVEKLTIKANNLKKKIQEFKTVGDPFTGLRGGLNRVENKIGGANLELERMQLQLSKINKSIAQENLEKLLSKSEVARLIRAKGLLEDLNRELMVAKKRDSDKDSPLFSTDAARNLEEFNAKAQQALKGIDIDVNLGRNTEEIEMDMMRVQEMIKNLTEKLEFKPKPLTPEDVVPQAVIDRVLALAAAFSVIQKEIDGKINKITKALTVGLEKTTVQVLTRVGAQLAVGGKAWDNFAASMLDIIGDMAINIGMTMIGIGNAINALRDSLTTAFGGNAIAAGIGLVILGGFLKGVSGALTESATGGGGYSGGYGGGGNAQLPEPEDIERRTASEINVTVQGSLVGQDELGKFLSDVISESNEKNGNVILNQRFA